MNKAFLGISLVAGFLLANYQPSAAAGKIRIASYDIYVRAMSANGLVPHRVLEMDIERARKDQQVKDSVPVARVADFTLLNEALVELRMR